MWGFPARSLIDVRKCVKHARPGWEVIYTWQVSKTFELQNPKAQTSKCKVMKTLQVCRGIAATRKSHTIQS